MFWSLLGLVAMLPVLGLVGIGALAAFSVFYLNGVAPDRFDAEDLRRQSGPRLPDARVGGIGLLFGFFALIFVPHGIVELFPETITLAPAEPMVLLRTGCGLCAAILLVGLWNVMRGGSGMFPWGGGKISRPAFAFLAVLPLLAVVAVWNRLLVEGVFYGTLPYELIAGISELEAPQFWMSLGMVVVLGPALEEFLFRGVVFGAAAKMGADAGRNPALFAVLFSAAAFTLVHPPAIWLPIFVLGLVLGCVRLHGHGLRDCIFLHIAYNAAVFFLTYPAS